jgi:4-hydroxybenzoate polyprenyltransferase
MIQAMAEESLSTPASTSIARPFSPVRHLRYVLKAVRPRQWTKNGIVFMALIFSVNQAWQPDDVSSWDRLLVRATLAALSFCAVSGAGYLINDVRDVEADRLHPTKRNRPIASGNLSTQAALAWAVILVAVGIAVAFAVDWRTGAIVVGYVCLQGLYTTVLKYEVILDVMAIAAGFVLRAMAGAYAVDVPTSPWLYVVTALGALFLAITKRRAEVALLADGAHSHRAVLSLYTPAFLDQMTAMVTASTVIAYALYTFTAESLPDNHLMMLTIPFVAYGVFRYLFLTLHHNEGGSPEEILLKDTPLAVCILAWVVTSMIVLTASR